MLVNHDAVLEDAWISVATQDPKKAAYEAAVISVKAAGPDQKMMALEHHMQLIVGAAEALGKKLKLREMKFCEGEYKQNGYTQQPFWMGPAMTGPNGEILSYEFKEEIAGGNNWRHINRKANGKLLLTVGHSGEKERFKQRSDGTFRYDDAAKALLCQVDQKTAMQKQHDLLEKNRPAAMRLQKQMGNESEYITSHNGVRIDPSNTTTHTVFLQVAKVLACKSEAEAFDLLKKLKELGIG